MFAQYSPVRPASVLFAALGIVGYCATALAQGEAELNKAIELKLSAGSLAELGEVIQFCQGALSKGFTDEADAEFARRLLSSTFLQRAEVVSRPVLAANKSDFEAQRRMLQFRQLAINDLRQAIELDPAAADAQLLLAELQALPGGDRAVALKAVRAALAQPIDDPATRVRALLLEGDLAKEPAERLAAYDEALRLAPDDPQAHRARGVYHAEKGELDAALTDLNAAIEIDPTQPEGYEARGLTYIALRKPDEALADLDRALELVPGSAVARFQRARAYLLKGNGQSAIDDLDRALEASPQNVAALLLRATAHQTLGHSTEALADADRSLEIRPGLVQALRARAAALIGLEQWQAAAESLEQVRQAAPGDLTVTFELAVVDQRLNRLDQAIALYGELIQAQPENLAVLQARGDALLSAGRQTEALADYEAAIKINPEHVGVLNNLAWLLATSPDDEIRNGDRALQLATTACEKTEFKMPHILSTLAAAHAELGDFAKAVEISRQAVDKAEEPQRSSLAKELESYEAGKPWREAPRQAAQATSDAEVPAAESEPATTAPRAEDTSHSSATAPN